MSLLRSPLSGWIRDTIEVSPLKSISFRAYMEACLYHPEYGYYMIHDDKIGAKGDFYTSSSIGPIMGQMLAVFFLRERERLAGGGASWRIEEWGGGNGKLALHILDEIERLDRAAYDRLTYIMVEKSGYHRSLQADILSLHRDRVKMGEAPSVRQDEQYGQEELDGQGDSAEDFTVVLANELLDAFPVYLIRRDPEGMKEIRVGWDDGVGQFIKRIEPLTDPSVLHWLADEQVELNVGQTAEVNLGAGEWTRDRASRLVNGMIVAIDYGDRSGELYAGHRMNGTLLCYRNHRAYDDPFAYPGEQDMTAHVNFDACIRAGEQAGISRWTYTTQKQFLVDAGILERLANTATMDPFSQAARNNRMIRQLLLSDGMSELFKVLVQYKIPPQT
jgi:SAM-dependent MidA family methyltransferase